MYLESTNSVNTRYWHRTAEQRELSQQNGAFERVQNTVWTGSAVHTTARTKSAGFSLHMNSGNEGDRMISAVSGKGRGGMTVFEPSDFDPDNPVYKVCIWDEEGNKTERIVDVTAVDPHNSDEASMFAYSCYLSESGQYPGAADTFLHTYGYAKTEANTYGAGTFGADADTEDMTIRLPERIKKDWTKLAAYIMQMQYDGGNLKGYLEYKKFVDFFS